MDGRSEERRTESGIELELVRDQRADGLSERFANVNKLVFLNVGVLNLSILDWESKQTRERGLKSSAKSSRVWQCSGCVLSRCVLWDRRNFA